MILTDDTKDRRRIPTKANILDAMNWLVKDSKAHDSLFFHCGFLVMSRFASCLCLPDSGHGGQIRDVDGDEADGFDEGVCDEDLKERPPLTALRSHLPCRLRTEGCRNNH